MRVSILGTTGQLATELRLQLPARGFELLPPERADLARPGSLGELLSRQRPELVLNAAAYTAVDRAEQEPDLARAVNAEAPGEAATWCRKHGAALIHVSTDYVFDGRKHEPYTESDATGPLGVYGATKLAGEVAVREGLPRHLIFRTSWVFSSHGHNFVKTMLRLADERPELRVVADQRGRPTGAGELARLIWAVSSQLQGAGDVPWGTYHLASAGETTWHGLAEAILDERARVRSVRPRLVAITSEEYPTPAKRPRNSCLDTTRFESTFQLEPRAWREELRQVVAKLLGPN
jgi:dTDP-4-dehydrorhamnose reductase